MRRLGLEEWSGLTMLVVCLGVGAPVLIGAVEPDIPYTAWTAAFVLGFVAMLLTAVFEGRPDTWRMTYAATVVLTWVVVVTAPNAGLLPVLLIVVATLGSDGLKLPANLMVIALNTGVLGLAWVRIDGEPVDLFIGVGFYGLVQVATVFLLNATQHERRMRRELTEANVELQAASVLLEDSARTAERLRISRELHDSIGHQLTVLTLELEAARHRQGEAAHENVERANRVARDLLSDVRSTVDTLRSEPSTDLAESLRSIGRNVPELDVTVEISDDVTADEEQTGALVRAMQEVVTNTLRHAEARELWVDVERAGDAIRLTAVDDGTGAGELVVGNGLRGLSERFAALGGEVDYNGAEGFRVTATVPVR